MTPELLKAIMMAKDKTRLEDLYLPYKPKAENQSADRLRGVSRASGK